MTRPTVLLTNPIGREGIQILERVAHVVIAPDVRHETLLEHARDADALLVRAYLPPNIFDVARRLRGVVRYAVGLDMIPMEAATEKAIPVANMPGVNSEAVAEYAISGLLLMARRQHRMNHVLRTVDWNTSRALGEQGIELAGRTVGIVGLGNIGSRLAEICHAGFRMRVLGNQRRLDALPTFVTGVDIDTLCRESDFIALCCPLTGATRNLISAERIALMKPGAGIVNVSRGPVVDEMALAKKVDQWNKLPGCNFGQLEATTDVKFINQQFQWNDATGKNTEHYFAGVSGVLGSEARGHMTAVVHYGFRDNSIFTYAELPNILYAMVAAYNKKEWDGVTTLPRVTDISIVVIDDLRVPNPQVSICCNSDILNIPV